MDVFIEQLVKRKITAMDTLKKTGIIFVALILFVNLFLLAPMLGFLGFLPMMGGVLAVYGAFRLIGRFNVEYEYVMTNGELDIDKIVALRKRTRLLTTHVSYFEQFGAYKKEEHASQSYKTRVFACDDPQNPDCTCAVFNHPTLGKTLLVFNPDARTTEEMKKFLPRSLR